MSALPTPQEAYANFSKQQQLRSQAYADFQLGFKKYLATKDHADYNSMVQDITNRFKAINASMRLVESRLKDIGEAEASESINLLQNLEQKKFQNTIKLQLLQTKFTHPTDRTDDPAYLAAYREARKTEAELIERINELLESLRDQFEDTD